jgi:hypothetical protein
VRTTQPTQDHCCLCCEGCQTSRTSTQLAQQQVGTFAHADHGRLRGCGDNVRTSGLCSYAIGSLLLCISRDDAEDTILSPSRGGGAGCAAEPLCCALAQDAPLAALRLPLYRKAGA